MKNVLYGYTIKVKLPVLSKKEKGEIMSVDRFTEDPEIVKYKENQFYQTVNFNEGTFT